MRSSLENGGDPAAVCTGKEQTTRDGFANSGPPSRFGKKPGKSPRRDMGQRRVLVDAGTSFLDRRFTDIGGENLERNTFLRVFQELRQTKGRSEEHTSEL